VLYSFLAYFIAFPAVKEFWRHFKFSQVTAGYTWCVFRDTVYMLKM